MTRRILTYALAALVAALCFSAVAVARGGTGEPPAPGYEDKHADEAPDTDAVEKDGEHGDRHGTKESDDFEGDDGDDSFNGHHGDDYLVGGSGDDVLHGGKGDDDVDGGEGDDRIRGGKGEDTLDGGDGNDRINARGDGRDGDEVTCGDGFDAVKLGRGDTITDASAKDPKGSCERVRGKYRKRGYERAACEAGMRRATREERRPEKCEDDGERCVGMHGAGREESPPEECKPDDENCVPAAEPARRGGVPEYEGCVPKDEGCPDKLSGATEEGEIPAHDECEPEAWHEDDGH